MQLCWRSVRRPASISSSCLSRSWVVTAEPFVPLTGAALWESGIAGLQAAVDAPEKVRGVQLMNVSLRMLHTTKQARPPLQGPFADSGKNPTNLTKP